MIEPTGITSIETRVSPKSIGLESCSPNQKLLFGHIPYFQTHRTHAKLGFPKLGVLEMDGL